MSAANAVVERVEAQPSVPVVASESAAILSLIERMAVNPEIDPERVERFIELRRQMARDEARSLFDAAIADAKAKIPPIVRNRKGHNDKAYADFAAYAKVVDPVLAEHGLSYRFRTQQTDKISVTCVLSHKSGHSEETTLSGPADASGSKNAIQAIGSTLTYLQRYTLVQALGLAAADDDDGAAAGAGELISDEQVDQLNDLIEAAIEATNGKREVYVKRFLDYMKADAIPSLKATDFKKAVAAVQSTMPKGSK